MTGQTILGILIPFAGTALGAAIVFFLKESFGHRSVRAMSGLAAGVMTAASVWSLIIPSVEKCADMQFWAFAPAAAGLWCGTFFLMLIDKAALRAEKKARRIAGYKSSSSTKMMLLAVTIHNIPEGMSVGIMFAGLAYENTGLSMGAALAFALGIGIQNLPEGAIISMPLRAEGFSKSKAFFLGTLSGAVEPVAAVITFAAASVFLPAMPYFLSFAAGAMIYVVICELIPEFSDKTDSYKGMLFFMAGFTLMMALDIAMG